MHIIGSVGGSAVGEGGLPNLLFGYYSYIDILLLSYCHIIISKTTMVVFYARSELNGNGKTEKKREKEGVVRVRPV